MAVYRYMMTKEYVRDWTIFDAIRELIANAFDAEIELRAPCSIRHHHETLFIENQGAKLDIKALYFGGTSKAGDSRLIGTYGEGLKLALMVLTRLGVGVKIVNDDESWTTSLTPDDNGVESFAITTRSRKATGMVSVEIPTTDDVWLQLQELFLRLMPPVEVIHTSVGDILLDMEHAGRRYSKGVFIDKEHGSIFGYDFKTLNVGRDRKSYRQSDATMLISQMWAEGATGGQYVGKCYQALLRSATEFGGIQYYDLKELPDKLLELFYEYNGTEAYPVDNLATAARLEHTGLKAVVVPYTMCAILKARLPDVDTILQKDRQKIVTTHQWDALTDAERAVLRGILHMAERLGVTAPLHVVDFNGPYLEGLMSEETIYLARRTLATYGKALGVFIHEAAHLGGDGDGEKGHVDDMHTLMEKAFTLLWREVKAPS